LERDAEPGNLAQGSLERHHPRSAYVIAAILEQRERRSLAGELRSDSAGNAAPVTCEVDATYRRAARDVVLRQKLLLDRIECERNFGKIRELRLRVEPESERDGIAGNPPFLACRVAIDEAENGVLPFGRERPDAVRPGARAGPPCRPVP